MKLHRDLGVTQETAWFMQQRIRKAFPVEGPAVFPGPAEAVGTYIGDRERNRHHAKELEAGPGPVGKTAAAVAKGHATKQVAESVVENTGRDTLPGTQVYADEAQAHEGSVDRESSKRSVAGFVRGQAHTKRGAKHMLDGGLQVRGT